MACPFEEICQGIIITAPRMECTNDFMEKGAPRIDPAFESAANKYTERKRQLDTFQR